MTPAMQFECSNPMFNRLHAAFVRTGMENTHTSGPIVHPVKRPVG